MRESVLSVVVIDLALTLPWFVGAALVALGAVAVPTPVGLTALLAAIAAWAFWIGCCCAYVSADDIQAAVWMRRHFEP